MESVAVPIGFSSTSPFLFELYISIASSVANDDDFVYVLFSMKTVIVKYFDCLISHPPVDTDAFQEGQDARGRTRERRALKYFFLGRVVIAVAGNLNLKAIDYVLLLEDDVSTFDASPHVVHDLTQGCAHGSSSVNTDRDPEIAVSDRRDIVQLGNQLAYCFVLVFADALQNLRSLFVALPAFDCCIHLLRVDCIEEGSPGLRQYIGDFLRFHSVELRLVLVN